MQKLFILLLVADTLITSNSIAQQSANLAVGDFENAVRQPNIQVLDVRTLGEFQTGHLKDAFLADWTNQQQFNERVQSLDKSKPVYAYCLSGARSGAAASWLREKGYMAYNLEGGIAAWKRAGKTVEELAKAKQMTLKEFQLMIPTDQTVLVDIGAVWCPPCKKMEPVIDSIVKSKKLSLHWVRIDGGDQTEIIKQLKVEALPTFLIYRNGKEVWRKNGIVDAKELSQHLNDTKSLR